MSKDTWDTRKILIFVRVQVRARVLVRGEGVRKRCRRGRRKRDVEVVEVLRRIGKPPGWCDERRRGF